MMNFWVLSGWLYESLFSLVPHKRLVEETAEYISKDHGNVLDAGCGTGRLAMYARTNVHGIDFSESMLRKARQRGQQVTQVDLNKELPIGDGTYDQVVSLNVLYAVPRPEFTLGELARVVAPGGRLILATPVTEQLTPLVTEHFRTASLWELLVSLANSPRLVAWMVNLRIRGWFSNSQFTFIGEAELVKMVESTGLTITSVQPCYAGIDRLIIAQKEA